MGTEAPPADMQRAGAWKRHSTSFSPAVAFTATEASQDTEGFPLLKPQSDCKDKPPALYCDRHSTGGTGGTLPDRKVTEEEALSVA